MNFTYLRLLAVFGNLISWLKTGFLAFFHLLGDAGKALIRVFGNLISWLKTGFLAFFHLLGDAGKALIDAVGILFNWLNHYPIIFVTFVVFLFLLLIGVKYLDYKQAKLKLEEEHLQAKLKSEEESRQAKLKLEEEHLQAKLKLEEKHLQAKRQMEKESRNRHDIRESLKTAGNVLEIGVDVATNLFDGFN